MYRILITLFFLPLLISAQKENKENIFSNAADAAKMIVAKQKLYAGDIVGALNAFREIEKNNPNDATLKYYVGHCYFLMKDVPNARIAAEKAVEINKDVKPQTYFLLGRIEQSDEAFIKASDYFNKFKSIGGEKEELEDADLYLSQCQNAVAMMASPMNVKVESLGDAVNSKYDDKNPCITADGKKLVFTTRRPENAADPVDTEGDGKFFENIYMATVDSSTGHFKSAANMGSSVNSKGHDACTSISPDGKQIFIYKNDMNNPDAVGGNIFYSKVTNGKWKAPEPIGKPVNTSYWEGGACISADGKRLFFTSERKGGFGNADIWMCEKNDKKKWGEPVNLGAEVNSQFDEAGMFMAPDGKTLFFCSNGPASMGGYDVFKTVYENGKWSKPANIGYPLNSPKKEGQFTLSADARYAYISSDRKGGMGESDIYKIDLMDYAILEKDGKRKGGGLSILKGTIREGFEGYGIQDVQIILKDMEGKDYNNTTTNEVGEYFFTLPAGKYSMVVRKKGFKDIYENIELSKSEKETVILEKGFLLSK